MNRDITTTEATLRRIVREEFERMAVPRSFPRDMKLKEAAKRLGKSECAVRRMAKAGRNGWSIAGKAGRDLLVRLPQGVML